MWRPYLPVSRGEELDGPSGTRSVYFEDRRGPDFLLPPARYSNRRCGFNDCERVLQAGLPRAADGVCGGGAEAAGRELGRQRGIRHPLFGTPYFESKWEG